MPESTDTRSFSVGHSLQIEFACHVTLRNDHLGRQNPNIAAMIAEGARQALRASWHAD